MWVGVVSWPLGLRSMESVSSEGRDRLIWLVTMVVPRVRAAIVVR